MTSLSTTAASCNIENSTSGADQNSSRPFLRNAWCWLKIGAVSIGAVGLVGASAYFNGMFGLTTSGIALAIAAVCFDLLKPIMHANKGWSVAAWVATAMSLVAAFSYQSINRTHLAEKHAIAVTQKSDARAAYDRALERRELAKSELATLPTTRPPKAIQADVRAILALPGVECAAPKSSKLYGPISRQHCPKVEKLKVELEVAQRRNELLTIMNREISAPNVATKAVQAKDVSAPASAFAGLLAGLGITTTVDFIVALSVFIYVVGLEIGSSRALVLVRQVHGQCFPPEKNVLPGVAPDGERESVSVGDSGNGDGGEASVVPEEIVARKKVLRLLKANDGQFQAAQRTIADKVGVSAGYLNKVLKTMSQEGEIIIQAHRTYGTRLRLVAVG